MCPTHTPYRKSIFQISKWIWTKSLSIDMSICIKNFIDPFVIHIISTLCASFTHFARIHIHIDFVFYYWYGFSNDFKCFFIHKNMQQTKPKNPIKRRYGGQLAAKKFQKYLIPHYLYRRYGTRVYWSEWIKIATTDGILYKSIVDEVQWTTIFIKMCVCISDF